MYEGEGEPSRPAVTFIRARIRCIDSDALPLESSPGPSISSEVLPRFPW
jgi:hypothetical protein